MTDLDLVSLVPSWELSLRAERKAPGTLKAYLRGVHQFLAWCETNDHPPAVDRRTVTAWVADIMESGGSPATATLRQAALKRFSAWLVEEGETLSDPLVSLRRPELDEPITEPLSPDQLRTLIVACEPTPGGGKTDLFLSRRDEAMVRFLAESGARSSEFLAMTIPDTDLREGIAIIRRGKGGKGRRVPFGPQTARAIDRYLRVRKAHKKAETPVLWLGARNHDLTYDGFRAALLRRARVAGLENFHPHQLRHTFADRWLDAEGSEGGLMTVAGWSRSEMLRRYTKVRREQRAADEARRLSLGDL